MNLKYRLSAWRRVLYSLFMTFPGVKSDIMDAEKTAEEIISGRSLIRFGDGEFGIYRGKDIHYQEWSQELNDEFQKIKDDYEKSPEHCPYLLAVPKRFMTVSGFRLMKKRVYVSSWAESRLQFKKSFRRDIPYGEAFLFEKKNKEIYSRIWDREDAPVNVIFVHNSEACAGAFSDTYNKNTFYVKCPPKNAFESIDILEKEIMSIIHENKWGKSDVSIAISAGPAGKVLVYRLSKEGYHSVDAGHCWDDPLEGI